MLSDNPFNEKQILQQLSQGSETAFEKIYYFYSQRLYSKVLRLVKSDVIAEEILQDVFLVIWDNRSNIDPEKSFCSYLFCIATNKCYDYYRKIKKDKEFLRKLTQPSGNTDTIEQCIINKEFLAIINDAIELLPPKRKLIFRLCKIEYKSYADVSTQLGISLSTISDHIVKANHFIKNEIVKGHRLISGDFPTNIIAT
jgi:RNA polymerase sigma-70 factor (family 1)